MADAADRKGLFVVAQFVWQPPLVRAGVAAVQREFCFFDSCVCMLRIPMFYLPSKLSLVFATQAARKHACARHQARVNVKSASETEGCSCSHVLSRSLRANRQPNAAKAALTIEVSATRRGSNRGERGGKGELLAL
jgi:hypothetical protein